MEQPKPSYSSDYKYYTGSPPPGFFLDEVIEISDTDSDSDAVIVCGDGTDDKSVPGPPKRKRLKTSNRRNEQPKISPVVQIQKGPNGKRFFGVAFCIRETAKVSPMVAVEMVPEADERRQINVLLGIVKLVIKSRRRSYPIEKRAVTTQTAIIIPKDQSTMTENPADIVKYAYTMTEEKLIKTEDQSDIINYACTMTVEKIIKTEDQSNNQCDCAVKVENQSEEPLTEEFSIKVEDEPEQPMIKVEDQSEEEEIAMDNVIKEEDQCEQSMIIDSSVKVEDESEQPMSPNTSVKVDDQEAHSSGMGTDQSTKKEKSNNGGYKFIMVRDLASMKERQSLTLFTQSPLPREYQSIRQYFSMVQNRLARQLENPFDIVRRDPAYDQPDNTGNNSATNEFGETVKTEDDIFAEEQFSVLEEYSSMIENHWGMDIISLPSASVADNAEEEFNQSRRIVVGGRILILQNALTKPP